MKFEKFTEYSTVGDVIGDAAFKNFGRLLFPVHRPLSGKMTLKEVSSSQVYLWYSHIQEEKTLDILNTLKERALEGEQVFYPIYTQREMAADGTKRDTGLFFFRGEPGGRTAICNAGGGFMYVGAMQDSFPHALELSKQGYNAFALIYRPGAQTACEDLARAIAFLHQHAEELDIDMDGYSLWGGSAGGRMAAWLGTYGPAAFGGDDLPRPGAVIIQYTGLNEYSPEDPPTFVCVGDADGIAP